MASLSSSASQRPRPRPCASRTPLFHESGRDRWKSRREGWSAAQDRSGDIGSGGVSTAAATKARTMAYLRFSASVSARNRPARDQQRGDHRQLEHQAEGEDQRHDQAEIFRDLRQQLDRDLPSPPVCCIDRKNHIDHRHEEEIDQRGAHQEQDRRRDQERQEGRALVLVEARRDELVDLRGDDREGDEQRAEHGDLDLGEEEFLRRRVDQLGLGRHRDRPRCTAHLNGMTSRLKRCLAKKKQTRKATKNAASAPDQPRAQLDQMLDQRLRLMPSLLSSLVDLGHALPCAGFCFGVSPRLSASPRALAARRLSGLSLATGALVGSGRSPPSSAAGLGGREPCCGWRFGHGCTCAAGFGCGLWLRRAGFAAGIFAAVFLPGVDRGPARLAGA